LSAPLFSGTRLTPPMTVFGTEIPLFKRASKSSPSLGQFLPPSLVAGGGGCSPEGGPACVGASIVLAQARLTRMLRRHKRRENLVCMGAEFGIA
jgi:hypothetical protein